MSTLKYMLEEVLKNKRGRASVACLLFANVVEGEDSFPPDSRGDSAHRDAPLNECDLTVKVVLSASGEEQDRFLCFRKARGDEIDPLEVEGETIELSMPELRKLLTSNDDLSSALTRTQIRCNELLEETRAQRRQLKEASFSSMYGTCTPPRIAGCNVGEEPCAHKAAFMKRVLPYTVAAKDRELSEELMSDFANMLTSNKEIAKSIQDEGEVDTLVRFARNLVHKNEELNQRVAQMEEDAERLVKMTEARERREEVERLTKELDEYQEREKDGPACDHCGVHSPSHRLICYPCANKKTREVEDQLKEKVDALSRLTAGKLAADQRHGNEVIKLRERIETLKQGLQRYKDLLKSHRELETMWDKLYQAD